MQLSPLLLKSYFVTNFSVKAANPTFSSMEEAAQALSSSKVNMASSLTTAKDDGNPRLWRVSLKLACRTSKNSVFMPYEIETELFGFFEVHLSIDESKIADFVTCNAPAIL